MKKKTAIRKLNRTQLKKEGTKEIYITGKNELMAFFDYHSIDELATSRSDERAKRTFLVRDENGKKLSELTLSVTKENNEVRLTGFGDFFSENNIKEVDQIVLECHQTSDSTEYFLSYCKNYNSRVLQAYSTGDSVENYNITTNGRGSIQFQNKEIPQEAPLNTYWLWDDNFDENQWNEMLGKKLDVIVISRRKVEKRIVLIEDTKQKIKKLLKAKSSSSNKLVFQEKKLYKIKELVGDVWKDADFGPNTKNLELTVDGGKVKISTNRDDTSFSFYEGGEVK